MDMDKDNGKRCKRCHRVLKNPVSIGKGYGAICIAKIVKERSEAKGVVVND